MDSSCNKLEQLFLACDVKGTGFIGRSELRELCKSFNIGPDDSDLIFDDLDRDGDGRINFEDFCRGFRDCINMDFGDIRRSTSEEKREVEPAVPEMQKPERREHGRRPKKKGLRRRDSMHHAFKQFSKTYGEENVLQYLGNSQEKIEQLYQELVSSNADPALRAQVENVLGSLINEVKRLQDDNKHMEKMYIKEKDTHENHLRVMEEELEAHVTRVDTQARQEAESRKEQEIRAVEQKLKDEINELQMHLRMFQKVDTFMQKDTGKGDNEEAQRKLDEAAHENRGLKMNLTETETSIALMRAEMSQIRSQYEEKCLELHTERQQLEEFVAQQDQYQRQLQLLQDANRRIQDTNDSLRHTMQDGAGRRRVGRPGSQLSSTIGDEMDSLWEAESVRSHNSRGRQPPEEVQYGIPRLMRDLDSSGGLKDPDEMDSGLDRSVKDEIDSPIDPSLREDLDDYDAQQDNGIDEYVLSTSDQCLEPGAGRRSPRSSPRFSSRRRHQMAGRSPLDAYRTSDRLCEATGPPERTYKVVFAGDAAVGKSTFITRVCKGIFLTNITSTLGVDFQVKSLCVEGKNVAIQLWDTAGQERFRSITKSYFRRADGVMLLYDITSERSFINVRQWVQSIDEVATMQIPIMLCANKCDMRDQLTSEGKSCVSREQGDRLARDFGAHFRETSAKTGEGMADAILELGRRMLTNEDVEVQTSALRVSDDRKSGTCAGSSSGSSCKK